MIQLGTQAVGLLTQPSTRCRAARSSASGKPLVEVQLMLPVVALALEGRRLPPRLQAVDG
ncbi:hypothetical protein ACH4VR_25455 [Streptomyces sp. NPDC020883]|uniref:hypothetical protein n=1 Tax=Streptomyces sp. NPDC020883 TaxID=3365099 RepID=UPI003792E441